MQRTKWFIGGVGFVLGVVACLIAVALLSPDAWRYKTLTGPVAIVPAGAADHGYLGAAFSNEPSRSLYIAEVSRAVPNDSDHVKVGDRVTSVNERTVTTFDEFQQIMARSKPGEVLELGVVREEQPITLRVRLISLSDMLAARDGGPAAP